MSTPSDVIMSPALGGITGGTSNGSTTVTVTTDSPAGYDLLLEAQNNPAMQSGVNSIPNHSIKLRLDYDFTITAGSAFGVHTSGTDASVAFLHNGLNGCGPLNGGYIDDVDKCWRGISSTTFSVASRPNANHPSGTATNLYFRVGVSAGAGVVDGLYTATTTLTALPL
jgi:hypothetical protein